MNALPTLIAIIFLLFAADVHAELEKFFVKGIPTMSQLPERGIKMLYQDSEGYMWYGTDNGLCRDDGYNIRVFHPSDANNINSIVEDGSRRLWISTDKGAYAIDKKDYSIYPLDEERIGSLRVQHIYITSDGDIWVSQYGNLRRYSPDLKWKKDYRITDRNGKSTYVSGFCQSRDGEIYMTSYSRGVYRYNKARDSFEMYKSIEEDVPLGIIFQDRKRDYFWMRDFRGHLYRFDPDSPRPFVMSICRPYGFPEGYSENLFDMTQDDRNGYIWGVSRNHLLIFRPESDGTLTPIETPMTKRFSGTMMSSLLSTPGAIWIGRFDGESSVVYLEDNMVSSYNLPTIKNRKNIPVVINGIAPSNDEGVYWMLQHRIGLMLYDLESDNVAYHNDFPSLSSLRLLMGEEIAESPSHNGVWASQERSLKIYAITHKGMEMACVDSVSIDHLVGQSTVITSMFEDSRRRVWLGTSNGLFAYDLESREFVANYPDLGYISGTVEANDNRIYTLSKEKGLYEIGKNRISPILHDGEVLKKGSALAVSPDWSVWACTDSGEVLEYKPDEGSVSMHGNPEHDGQYGIKSLVFSDDGHGWMLSDSYLIEFNPKTGQYFAYRADSDIPLFRYLSLSQAGANGCIVGGVGGVSVIKSNSMLDDSDSEARTLVSDVIVGGISRLFAESEFTFDGESLVLGPDEKNIEIFFASLDYRQPSKTRFAYRLRGYDDDDWQYTSPGKNSAFYTSIPKGKNYLEVRFIDEYGRESSQTTTILIERLPHFYETWWAFLIYGVIVVASIGAFFYYYRRRLNKKNEEKWADSKEMLKMRTYLSSPVTLPEQEFQELDRALLEKATKTVEANIDDPDFDVNTLASSVNMSRSTFFRKLKTITGKTPLDFIRDIKMKHACRLLENNNHTVSQVADMVGFSDRRYFSSYFRKTIGMTPKEYQNFKIMEAKELANDETNSSADE